MIWRYILLGNSDATGAAHAFFIAEISWLWEVAALFGQDFWTPVYHCPNHSPLSFAHSSCTDLWRLEHFRISTWLPTFFFSSLQHLKSLTRDQIQATTVKAWRGIPAVLCHQSRPCSTTDAPFLLSTHHIYLDVKRHLKHHMSQIEFLLPQISRRNHQLRKWLLHPFRSLAQFIASSLTPCFFLTHTLSTNKSYQLQNNSRNWHIYIYGTSIQLP